MQMGSFSCSGTGSDTTPYSSPLTTCRKYSGPILFTSHSPQGTGILRIRQGTDKGPEKNRARGGPRNKAKDRQQEVGVNIHDDGKLGENAKINIQSKNRNRDLSPQKDKLENSR